MDMSSSLRKHVLACCLVVIGLFGVSVAWAEPLDVWHWRNPLPQGNPLVGVTFGKGRYVAVAPRDTVVSSADAESWSWHPFGSSAWLTGVTFEGETFFAFGDGIWSSGHGKEWVRRSDEIVQALAQGGGQYVGVGWLGTIVTSPDGLGWLERDSGTGEELNAIVYGAGRFVAVGGYYTNGVILVSADGISWTNRTISTDILNGVAWGNGQFVAVGYSWKSGEDVSLVSSNGINWVRHSRRPEDYFWSVCFGQGLFVAVDARRVSTSADGVGWTERYAEPDRNALHEVKWVNGLFVAVGNAGAIVTSEDGIHWTRRTVGSASTFRGLAVGGGRTVAVSDGGVVLTSDDGKSWRE